MEDRPSWDQLLKHLEDPQVRSSYERAERAYLWGRRLARMRRSAGLEPWTLARALRVSPEELERLEAGALPPPDVRRRMDALWSDSPTAVETPGVTRDILARLELARLREDPIRVEKVIHDPATPIATMPVSELLMAFRGVGKARATKIMDDLAIGHRRKVKGLRPGQKEALVAKLAGVTRSTSRVAG